MTNETKDRMPILGASLCILFCFISAAQQTYFLFTTRNLVDKQLNTFFSEYSLRSSVEIAGIVLIGIALSASLIIRATSIRCLAVVIFCMFNLWSRYLSNLGIFFHQGISDGSFEGAASMWWRLHAPNIYIYGFSFMVLIGSSVFSLVGAIYPQLQCHPRK
jgi:hypothetical protein